MRCPKCRYVSFDGQNRCRNCGYDLSLAQPADLSEPIDLSTRPGNSTAAVLADLSLKPDPPPPSASPSSPSGIRRDSGYPGSAGSSPAGGAGTGPGPGSGARGRGQDVDPLDLPLFEPERSTPDRAMLDRSMPDRPLISPSTPPRPPLSVRRPTGEIPRARPRVTPSPTPSSPSPRQRVVVEEPQLDLDVPDRLMDGTNAANAANAGSVADIALRDAPLVADEGRVDGPVETTGDPSAAPLGARAAAALLDLAFLALVDATVLYFTLRLTDVPLQALERLPIAPLVGFLALVNGGYLALFTAASGQTMGKMAMGVKVVSMQGGAVAFGNAVLRAILWLLTIVPFGVGAIPALLTDDRRALHDRLADTRVIRVE